MAKEYTLRAVNDRLRLAKSAARVRDRRGRLELRATLPPKPGSDRPFPYQQEISLRIPANADGFRRAEQLAHVLSAELIGGSFRWEKYMSDRDLPENKSIAQWIADFEKHYRGKSRIKERTWTHDWLQVFISLPANSQLTVKVLMAAIEETPPDTRHRKETCEKLQALANFAKLGADFSGYRGNYGPNKVVREIPTDTEIVAARETISNPQWRWVFGMMAAYGLRPYEVFFCQWNQDGLFVPRGKNDTDRIITCSLYPEWETEWNLRSVQVPDVDYVSAYQKGTLGDKVSRQFRRLKIGFTPYDLRHAFALRGSVTLGLPPATTAEMMGHSVSIHLKTYNRHISAAANRQIVDRVLSRDDRAKPPTS